MMRMMTAMVAVAWLVAGPALADEIRIRIQRTTEKGPGETIGTVTARDTRYGLLLVPDLKGLRPGAHGFHVHANGDCGPAVKQGKVVPGGAAGGHFDPKGTGKHLGPYEDGGHLGDLPVLVVDPDGRARLPVLAPRLQVKDIRGRALMIHAGGDNYSDRPKPLGGGGSRVACGVVR